MKISMYFFSSDETCCGAPAVAPGYGFTPQGRWRPLPLPRGAALALDDRFLPGPEGLREALDALRAWQGGILCDFERPRAPALARLLEALAGRDAAVPPGYADLPHSRVLVGPYLPGRSFSRWLADKRRRYGQLVLDAEPIAARIRFGQAAAAERPEPGGPGLPCPGAICRCAGFAGGFDFWDTRKSLQARCAAADCPAIVFDAAWAELAEQP